MMRRFFFDPLQREGSTVVLSLEESKHLTKVLRLQPGNAIELLDGLGNVYSGLVVSIGTRAETQIVSTLITAEDQDPGKSLLLCQGLLKGDKMDTVVQKCTELGVTALLPFHSSRCQGRLTAAVAEKKLLRWQRIGLAACKQCQRTRPMTILPAVSYELLTGAEYSLHADALQLLFWEEEQAVQLRDLTEITAAESLAVMIGPEGGISKAEVEAARSRGWQTVSLGKSILRAETASLTAISIIQFLCQRL
jgi:16S rRNA (uracil1498-N3)-methyltransferase